MDLLALDTVIQVVNSKAPSGRHEFHENYARIPHYLIRNVLLHNPDLRLSNIIDPFH